jgi:hypothetical protein
MRNCFFNRTCRWFLSVAVITLFIFLESCNKLEKTGIGSELIPGSDKLITDTLYLNVETSLSGLDSVNLDTSVIRRNEAVSIGFTSDPLLGTTTAAAYFQALPASYPFSFPVAKDSLFLDSLVLAVNYAAAYGDTTALTKVNVYRITDPAFVHTKSYKIFESPSFNTADLLGSGSFTNTKLKAGYKLAFKNDSVFNQLRIPLSAQLGRDLLDQDNVNGALKSDSAFRAFLNGVAIVPDSTLGGNGVLHYFTLNTPSTSLQLYYRVKKRDGSNDTTVSVFPFATLSANTAIANKIHRQVPNGLSGNNGSYAYVMTSPGISSYVNIKGLDALKGQPYIVHRAELIAEQADDNSVSSFFTPPSTHLYAVNTLGQQTPIPYDSVFYYNRVSFDFIRNVTLNSILQEYCGGLPSYQVVNNQKLAVYRYQLTRFVQNVINGNTSSRTFKLAAPYYAEFAGGNISLTPLNAIGAGRVKLYGGNHPTKPMRLIIYYSKP